MTTGKDIMGDNVNLQLRVELHLLSSDTNESESCQWYREQPIFSCKAHVFHIDPKTKRSWISASSAAVSVSFFYDSTRSLYRIISVEGTKAVINSTITPNMTFTKTSQKFGQWSDVRANTVYGLGFSSEAELNKFIEKFQEVKEATRLAAAKATTNGTGTGVTPVTSANASPITARACVPPPRSTETPLPPSDSTPLLEPPNSTNTSVAAPLHNSTPNSQTPATVAAAAGSVTVTANNAVPNAAGGTPGDSNTLKTSLVAHQRSQSLSGLQGCQNDFKPGPETNQNDLEAGPETNQRATKD